MRFRPKTCLIKIHSWFFTFLREPRLGFIGALGYSAAPNLKLKQIQLFFFCKSHLTSVFATQQKVLEFLWQQEIWAGERKDRKMKCEKESAMREKRTGWKNRNKTREPAGCQGHLNLSGWFFFFFFGDSTGVARVQDWSRRQNTHTRFVLFLWLVSVFKRNHTFVKTCAAFKSKFLHYLKRSYFHQPPSPSFSPLFITFPLLYFFFISFNFIFITLRNPIISMSVKPQAWSLKQRRANLIWVNSGALCRWIKHFFSLMLPGLIKSQIPPLSSAVTQYRNPCAGWNRKDEVSYCISSALGTRRDNRTMWRYAGRGNACRRVPLDQFFLMNDALHRKRKTERKKEKESQS